MEIQGYMIRVWWDGHTLRVHPTSRPAAMALLGDQHREGDLVVPREQMASVRYRRAGLLVNGRVTIRTTGGRIHMLHFRRKQQPGMAALARELGAI